MGEITLITGGSRSGKSGFAQRLAEQENGPRLFLATCPVTDGEMEVRIRRHVADRAQAGWHTVEEQVNIARRITEASGCGVILVDCLTLWINNLMYAAGQAGKEIDEDTVGARADEVVAAARTHPGPVILVTNEVGLGIVPENEDARRFRDLVGRCNQRVAAASDRVYLVSCGIPLQLKGNNDAL